MLDLKLTTPQTRHDAPRYLYKHADTQEYCICIGRPGKQNSRWVSLHTTNRLEAMRRLERTGVASIVETAMDERFTERVVEVLTQKTAVRLDDVVREWLADKALRISKESMVHPKTIASQFIRLYSPKAKIDEPTAQEVNAWINTAPSFTRRQRRMSVLSDLFTFAFDNGHRKDNLGKRLGLQTRDLTFAQMEREIREPFTQEEFDQLMACDKVQGFWRWAIQLAWWLGFRMSDVCKMQWGSFCAVPGKIVVWQVKTRTRVELDLSDPVMGGSVIPAVIQEMRANVTDAIYCFPEMRELYDKRQQATVELFREQCLLAGLDGRKTFHSFRKSAAFRWKLAGRSLKEIGCLLGHEGTGATAFYLETTRPQ